MSLVDLNKWIVHWSLKLIFIMSGTRHFMWIFIEFSENYFSILHIWRVNCLQTKFQLDPSWFGLVFKRFMKTAFSGFQISGPAISKIILILKRLYLEIQNVFFKSVKCVRFLDLSVTEQKWFRKNWISFGPLKPVICEKLSESTFAFFRDKTVI